MRITCHDVENFRSFAQIKEQKLLLKEFVKDVRNFKRCILIDCCEEYIFALKYGF